MTNTELSLDQLTAIAGGVTAWPDGGSCTDPRAFNPGSLDSRVKKWIMNQREGGVYSPPDQDGNEDPTTHH